MDDSQVWKREPNLDGVVAAERNWIDLQYISLALGILILKFSALPSAI